MPDQEFLFILAFVSYEKQNQQGAAASIKTIDVNEYTSAFFIC